ncbi:hypothetical protein INT44_000178 [Umbelopsis vinacea]|uniref:Uncharacterized protein n=1 Tax=Umbelopsis vinacea TaxID=44442 RepID=A0A8H7PI94_9FUNG|nr:hypothetical protein INT44_000178 [Umbelopsis vinacea]
MSFLGNLFNLKHQLVVYGAHHNNKVNVIIHIICVPIIFWTASFTNAFGTTFTALVFASNTGPLLDVSALPSYLQWLKLFGPDLGFFAAVFYSVYYLFLDPATALLYAPVLYGMSYYATYLHRTNAEANNIALGLHIVSWILQFIGHGVAEKRSPKLLDNLIQALVLAPFFVFFEILFTLGYRPKLHKEMMIEVNKDVAAFKAKREAQKKSKKA